MFLECFILRIWPDIIQSGQFKLLISSWVADVWAKTGPAPGSSSTDSDAVECLQFFRGICLRVFLLLSRRAREKTFL